ncbi:MAG: glycosyltransferase, partial [bacterium]|nr:glycosyltransferase [bacterium]
MKGKKVQENYRVVFSIDDNFANYLGVTIQSLIDNSDKNKNYTVSILYDKLSEKSIENLLLLEESNVKIEFYNVCEYLEKLNIEGLDASMHWSVATYYRILIPFLFKDDKKVLYMDCDTVILDDVSKIFEVDLKGAEIAAVFDYDSVCYDKNRIKYIQNKLKLTDYKKYFNAVLILFDIER